MGTIIEFPAGEISHRSATGADPSMGSATVIILPVIRIERHGDETTDGHGPGAAPGGRRGRRARS
ncbi:MAG: hypothetical protein EPO23_00370 [Xanthobacteraceae bacterium]|nr:MAG: hypothetical protein EPO23_00370 [Xanthobacteraceae bacterium]